MKNIFTYKRTTIAPHMRVWVSKHFYYSTFGVRGRYATIDNMGTFLTVDTPGTGFFAHSSDSHSYLRFVNGFKKRQKQNLWTLIAKKEPSYAREIQKVEEALKTTDDKQKKGLLEYYMNCLLIGKEAEVLERYVRGLKDHMKASRDRSHTSLITHFKSQIATLEHDVKAARRSMTEGLAEESVNLWAKTIDMFEVIVNSRRVWSVETGGTNNEDVYEQVFADMGVFDFLYSPYDTPIIRDHRGLNYYLYPQGVICARSSVDFDIHPIETLTFQFAPVDINSLINYKELSKSRSSKSNGKGNLVHNLFGMCHGDTIGMVHIPELNIKLLCNRKSTAENFVNAMNAYKESYLDNK